MFSSRYQNVTLIMIGCILMFYLLSHNLRMHPLAASADIKPSRRIAIVMLQIPKNPETLAATTKSEQEELLAEAYKRCIESHQSYGRKYGYKVILETVNVSGRLAYWQKILSLSRIMYDALETGSYDWLFWTDSDTLILNDRIELESFLPPDLPELQQDEQQVHVLMARDHRGWNNGVFFIRVHPWSLAYLLRTYFFPDFYPRFRSFEQSAMARLYEGYEDVRKHMVNVPMRWFNAYPSGKDVYNARQVDFQIHFPGDANKNMMIDRVINDSFEEPLPLEQLKGKSGTGSLENLLSVAQFWDQIASGTIKRGEVYPHQ